MKRTVSSLPDPMHEKGKNNMKRSFLKLVVGSLLLSIPLATLAAAAPVTPAGPILLVTADSANASITGQAAINAALTKEVGTFTNILKALLDGTGHATIAKDTSAIELTNTGHPLSIAVASLLPKQISHVGIIYWGPDAQGNIMISVDFYSVNYKDTKGSFKLGDKNYGKKMLFLAAGSGAPATTAEKLAAEFNVHLRATAFAP